MRKSIAAVAVLTSVALLAGALMIKARAVKTVELPNLSLTAQQWREDLRCLADELPRRHKNAFHSVTRTQFQSAVDELARDIPSLQGYEVVVGMQRITGS